ncbi:MAG: hypothetical protein O7G88_23150 [bacterium]|nr:hypothetical protein [bacterium]
MSTHIFAQRVTGGASIKRVTELAVLLASAASGALSGFLTNASKDVFDNLPPKISQIVASDALMLRRVELPFT